MKKVVSKKEPTLRDLAKLIVGVSRYVESTHGLVEGLAVSTKHGLDDLNEKYGSLDKRFGNLEWELSEVKGGLRSNRDEVKDFKNEMKKELLLLRQSNKEDIDFIASDLIIVKKKVGV